MSSVLWHTSLSFNLFWTCPIIDYYFEITLLFNLCNVEIFLNMSNLYYFMWFNYDIFWKIIFNISNVIIDYDIVSMVTLLFFNIINFAFFRDSTFLNILTIIIIFSVFHVFVLLLFYTQIFLH